MTINKKWETRFLDLAAEISSWSKDPSTKVGAVIVRPDKTIAGTGYNGFPRGCTDNESMYEDRIHKLSRVIHAEQNAILNSRENLEGYYLFITMPPCDRCAAHIVQAGIKHIYYPYMDIPDRWIESIRLGHQMFSEVGVEVHVC